MNKINTETGWISLFKLMNKINTETGRIRPIG